MRLTCYPCALVRAAPQLVQLRLTCYPCALVLGPLPLRPGACCYPCALVLTCYPCSLVRVGSRASASCTPAPWC